MYPGTNVPLRMPSANAHAQPVQGLLITGAAAHFVACGAGAKRPAGQS